MVLIVRQFIAAIDTVFFQYTDPRTDTWWSINTPIPVFIATIVYVYFCLSLGPRLMRHRQPFDLKTPIAVYNVAQVLANGFLFIQAVRNSYWRTDFDLLCQTILDRDDTSPQAWRVLYCGYAYLVIKIVDYLDTVFFVLRKQSKQVSFLHVYHHAVMGITAYSGCRYYTGGNTAVLVVCNTFVHTFMYMYYFLSAQEATRDFAFRCKRYMTQLQLVQFLVIGVHYLQAGLDAECRFPKHLSVLMAGQSSFMVSMFLDFYVRNYWRKVKK